MRKVPAGLYGDGDGVLDPDRVSTLERHTKSTARLAEERADNATRSPLIRSLRQAAHRATGNTR